MRELYIDQSRIFTKYVRTKNLPIPSKQKNFASNMRKEMTLAEQKLWYILRDRRFVGYKFRRQFVIGDYIADFVCIAAKLIVEADGSQHVENQYDLVRDEYLKSQGYRILRFWNNHILFHTQSVAEAIYNDLTIPSPALRAPSPEGRGDSSSSS